MENMWTDIEEFHNKFGIQQSEAPGLYEHDPAMMEFRIKFLQEELNEFGDAVAAQDLTKAFDALIDLVYVALGTAYICNLPFEEGWQHVHDANMLKQRVKKKSASKRGSEYDIIKPKGWVSPETMLTVMLLEKTYQIRRAKFIEENDNGSDDKD